MKLPNQDKIRRLAENETYKYLGIFEADTLKQDVKDKIKKRMSQEKYKTTQDKALLQKHYQ